MDSNLTHSSKTCFNISEIQDNFVHQDISMAPRETDDKRQENERGCRVGTLVDQPLCTLETQV